MSLMTRRLLSKSIALGRTHRASAAWIELECLRVDTKRWYIHSSASREELASGSPPFSAYSPQFANARYKQLGNREIRLAQKPATPPEHLMVLGPQRAAARIQRL